LVSGVPRPGTPTANSPGLPSAAPPSGIALGLSHYLALARRRSFLIVGIVAIFVAGGLLWSHSAARGYTADATILINRDAPNQLLNPSSASGDPTRDIDTAISVLEGSDVRADVAEQIADPEPVRGTASGSADVIGLQVTTEDAERAAELANAYAAAFVSDLAEREATPFRNAAESLNAQLADAEASLSELTASLATATPEEAELIEGQRQSLVESTNTYRQRIDELNVAAASATGSASVLEAAAIPTTGSGSTPLRSAILAGFVGLIVALALVVVLDLGDDHLRTPDDLLPLGLPVLASIPRTRSRKNRPGPCFSGDRRQGTRRTQVAFQRLRAITEAERARSGVSAFLVASPSHGEGATTVSENLARMLGDVGHATAFLDLRAAKPVAITPSLEPSAAAWEPLRTADSAAEAPPERRGVLLLGAGRLMDAQSRSAGLIPSPLPRRDSSILQVGDAVSATEYEEFLRRLSSQLDYLVVDTGPVLTSAEPLSIAQAGAAVIIVVAADRTRLREVRQTIDALAQVRATVLGIVLNFDRSRQ
jgi:succinoglycan biosynthesis transport protein ExoP